MTGFCKVLAHLMLLADQRQAVFQLDDIAPDCILVSVASGNICIQSRQLRLLFGQPALQHGGLIERDRFGHVGRRHKCAATGQLGVGPQNVGLTLPDFTPGPVAVGAAVGGVKFNQYVARLHALPVTHGNDTQDTGLQRLDHLALARRNDPALR